jgi:hypothetical protein
MSIARFFLRWQNWLGLILILFFILYNLLLFCQIIPPTLVRSCVGRVLSRSWLR